MRGWRGRRRALLRGGGAGGDGSFGRGKVPAERPRRLPRPRHAPLRLCLHLDRVPCAVALGPPVALDLLPLEGLPLVARKAGDAELFPRTLLGHVPLALLLGPPGAAREDPRRCLCLAVLAGPPPAADPGRDELREAECGGRDVWYGEASPGPVGVCEELCPGVGAGVEVWRERGGRGEDERDGGRQRGVHGASA